MVQQSRFLICPGGLASHILSRNAKQLIPDWEKTYAEKPVLLETFVEEGRFRGTCYAAANCLKLGQTQGRGRMKNRGEISRSKAFGFIHCAEMPADLSIG